MGAIGLDAVRVTALAIIATPSGDVMHGMKREDPGYAGFGEAYFSWIASGGVKAWKRHTRMTMNLIVPVGGVRFVFAEPAGDARRVEELGPHRYARLTVPPGIWFGFQGLHANASLVVNLASTPHDPSEVERCDRDVIPFDWSAS